MSRILNKFEARAIVSFLQSVSILQSNPYPISKIVFREALEVQISGSGTIIIDPTDGQPIEYYASMVAFMEAYQI